MNPILRLDGVCKHFGGVVAAEDVTFSVMPGTVHGLIGPNGAGKSTLMNLISGIYTPDKGRIYFDETDITGAPSHARARMGIGRTFQTPRFLQRSNIRDNLLLGTDLGNQMGYLKSFFGKKGSDFESELNELMQYVGFGFDWDDDISALAYGQRKQLEIVRAMLAHPRVMLVDEPAAGLNNKEIDDVMELLGHAAKDKGIGVLLIEHSMDMIMNICEQIVVLCFGKVIAEGNPEQISSNEAVIEAYLGRENDA
ncbi:ABC transporter ATP-binding protein [Agathobaculum sp.]|uniref:ABC transporter ATP-binding protein n=1 Tax=Agathobaculum sp. TaxID=2048138 RepID=UPI002A7EDA9D|nr:ABC transporter ATP-binding protein [Agathobaculum sp.]MDY3617611.1 ABC transporter ATP-binding protein [Agathobaculum sp.]